MGSSLLRKVNVDIEKLGEVAKNGAVDGGGGGAVKERLVTHKDRQCS
jgi:hypothetical protein